LIEALPIDALVNRAGIIIIRVTNSSEDANAIHTTITRAGATIITDFRAKYTDSVETIIIRAKYTVIANDSSIITLSIKAGINRTKHIVVTI